MLSLEQALFCTKETINNIVEGVGHFEPLKHYAEVHLLMEPGQLGSGITFESNLNESLLSRNWQKTYYDTFGREGT